MNNRKKVTHQTSHTIVEQGGLFMQKKSRLWYLSLLIGFGVALIHATPSYSGSCTVDSGSDAINASDGKTTLPEAIKMANNTTGKYTITIASSITTITLNSTLDATTGNITIEGNGAKIQCNNCSPFFVNGGSLTLSNLTIDGGLRRGGKGGNGYGGGGGGAAGMGGALMVNKGKASCNKVTFQNCKAQGGDGGESGDLNGGGGGGFGGDGTAGSSSTPGSGGSGGLLGGSGGSPHNDGGEGGGGGGGNHLYGEYGDENINSVSGNGGFAGGGGGGTNGSNGGFGGGGGGSAYPSFVGHGGRFGGSPNGQHGGGGAGLGGAIFVRTNAEWSATNCKFIGNTAFGGAGDSDTTYGQGKGGAVFIMIGATATMSNNSFEKNYSGTQTHQTADNTYTDTGDSTAFPPVSASSNWMFYE